MEFTKYTEYFATVIKENSESLRSHIHIYAMFIISHIYHCSTNAFTEIYIVTMESTVVKESSHSCTGAS